MRLALVVVEEHTGRTVHLRDDHTLCAVDDERTVLCHERKIAHVNVLFLDVLDGLGLCVLVDFEHDQAQRHLERRCESHSALLALIDVIFGLLELVLNEFQRRGFRKIADRENRFENGLKPLVGTSANGLINLEKLVVGIFLNFDQVRHHRNGGDAAEGLTNPFATSEGLRHMCSSQRSAL